MVVFDLSLLQPFFGCCCMCIAKAVAATSTEQTFGVS
jgi:hypothetical protein